MQKFASFNEMEFSKHLKIRRKQTGLTQAQIAGYIGVSEKVYSGYENEAKPEKIPKLLVALDLSRILGCTVDTLLSAGKKSKIYDTGGETINAVAHRAQNDPSFELYLRYAVRFGEERIETLITQEDILNELINPNAP
ncbi:MAG: helix-turn-helix transcriptional regulator [Crocinitomicaceae bacterium]|nr:helix-turn-helix transcriptional regulator [Crocinitomicaceae bacterium]